MQKTRREIVDDLLDFAGELGDSNARTTAERMLNRALESIWLKHPWSQFVSPAPLQITMVVNRRSYALPDHFGRFRSPINPVRNLTRGTWLQSLPDEDLFRQYPEAGTTLEAASTPSLCTLLGSVGVQGQPLPTGEALQVVSSSAGDTDIRVSVVGDDSLGRNTRIEVMLDGLNAVAVGTWSYVDEFGKAYPAGEEPVTPLYSSRGTVTLRKTSDGTVLQTLFAEEAAKLHRILSVYPKPNVADVLAIPFIRAISPRLKDADVLPSNWGPALYEEMAIEWQVNTGDLTRAEAGRVPRPALLDLICFENENQPRGTRPFGAT